MTTTKPQLEDEETFIAIRWLIAFLRVLEDLITAISGYGIVFALGVGVVDLFTNGQLTNAWPWIDWLYAFALAAGIGGQLIAVASRASRAFHVGNWGAGLGFTALALLLGVVEYEAAVVYGYHRVFNQSVTTSLAQLGISQGGFVQLRSFTSVALALLSGFLRYQPKVKKSIEEIEAEEERKRRIAKAKATTRQEQLASVRGLIGQSLGKQSTEQSAENAPALPDELGADSPADETTITADESGLYPDWLPANRWRWQELQAWVREELRRDISEDQAKDIIKTTPHAEKAPHVGSPMIASIGWAKQRAKTVLKVRKVTPIVKRNMERKTEPSGGESTG